VTLQWLDVEMALLTDISIKATISEVDGIGKRKLILNRSSWRHARA
jgi:hypothetical protein